MELDLHHDKVQPRHDKVQPHHEEAHLWLESLHLDHENLHLHRDGCLENETTCPPSRKLVNIEEMRRVMTEELNRALAGMMVAGETTALTDVDMEKKYGAKLDRMLGGLVTRHANGEGG